MDKLDFVVLSPGVPTDLPLVNAMRDKKIMIIGEIELAYQVAKGKSLQLQERMARRQPLHWWEKFYPITLRM